jgi:hypothetical protein
MSETFNPHRNRTQNGVIITLGLRVKDYDFRIGTVIADDNADKEYLCCNGVHKDNEKGDKSGQSSFGGRWIADDAKLKTLGCHLHCRHDHWFSVKHDDGSVKSFNGDRLTTDLS